MVGKRGWGRRLLAGGMIVAVAAAGVAGCGNRNRPDPLRDKQWALKVMHLPQAWKHGEGDGVTIAVLDTGVDTNHPDLAGRTVAGYNFVNHNANPQDENGHGTHVAGIAAAATDNGIGIAGGAPDAKIMPIKVLSSEGHGSRTAIANGIVWAAAHGAKVINMSLGESGLMSHLLRGGELNPAIRRAAAKGAVVVAAAGNDAEIKQPYHLSTPVLIVNASDQHNEAARFTNFGALGAVSAPGVDIWSTLPTYQTPMTKNDDSGYGAENGTSMAAPYVSALAAMLIADHQSVRQTMHDIRSTAVNPHHDPRLGYGIVNAEAAMRLAG